MSSRRFIAITLKALKTPNVEDKLATLGLEPMVMTPAEFDAHVKSRDSHQRGPHQRGTNQ